MSLDIEMLEDENNLIKDRTDDPNETMDFLNQPDACDEQNWVDPSFSDANEENQFNIPLDYQVEPSMEEPVEEKINEDPVDKNHAEDFSGEKEEPTNHKLRYLQYGGDDSAISLDLESTLRFLCDEMKYGGGELAQARNSKEVPLLETDSYSDCCSYCGVSIFGVDYYLLSDGRKRCTNCTRSLVKSLGEMNQIFQDVMNNMELFFNITIEAPIKIEMMDERKLKKKIPHRIDKNSDFEWYSAVTLLNGNGYIIYLENGAPRISIISTLVYAITCIWQYAKQKKNANLNPGSFVGMSLWAEIQYLYFIGEQAIAKRKLDIIALKEDHQKELQKYEEIYPFSTQLSASLNTPFFEK